jgi:hypothetical protein
MKEYITCTFIQVEQTPLWILPVGVGPYTSAHVTWILVGAILQQYSSISPNWSINLPRLNEVLYKSNGLMGTSVRKILSNILAAGEEK